MGTTRLVAAALSAVATRLRPYTGDELAPRDPTRWRQLRASIRQRFALRAQGYRFRRDPAAYLDRLEELALKPSLQGCGAHGVFVAARAAVCAVQCDMMCAADQAGDALL